MIATAVTLTEDDVRIVRRALQARIYTLENWLATPMDADDSPATRASGMMDLDDCRAALKKFDRANRRVDAKRLDAARLKTT